MMGPGTLRGGSYLVLRKLTLLDAVHLSSMSRSFRRLPSPFQLLTFSGSNMRELDKNDTVQFVVKNTDLGQTSLRTKVTTCSVDRSPL